MTVRGTAKREGGVTERSTVHSIDSAGVSFTPVTRSAAQFHRRSIPWDTRGVEGSSESQSEGDDVDCI